MLLLGRRPPSTAGSETRRDIMVICLGSLPIFRCENMSHSLIHRDGTTTHTLLTSSSSILSASNILIISSSLFLVDRPVGAKTNVCLSSVQMLQRVTPYYFIPYRKFPSLSQYIFLKSYLPPFFCTSSSSASLSLSNGLCCKKKVTKLYSITRQHILLPACFPSCSCDNCK